MVTPSPHSSGSQEKSKAASWMTDNTGLHHLSGWYNNQCPCRGANKLVRVRRGKTRACYQWRTEMKLDTPNRRADDEAVSGDECKEMGAEPLIPFQ